MIVNTSAIYERDIDLLFIDEFISDKDFANILLSKTEIGPYKIIEIHQSLVDINFGESDIVIVLEDKNGIKHGILIEDKINAPAMPEQYERYVKRGKEAVKMKEYNDFYVFIIAPKSYLESNAEAKKYPNKIAYEELLNYMERLEDDSLLLKIALFKKALDRKASGNTAIKDERITEFWKRYSEYQQSNFKDLNLNYDGGDKPGQSIWTSFNTRNKNNKIKHKSNMGCVDLEFAGYGHKIGKLRELTKSLLDDDMSIVKTGKSAVIRIEVEKINFNEEFETYKKKVKTALLAVGRLSQLEKKINC